MVRYPNSFTQNCSQYSQDIESRKTGGAPARDIHFAIGNFIRDGLKGGPIIVQGDGTPQRSYLYAADLAIWLWTILFKGQSLRPNNIGNDEWFSTAEVAQNGAKQFPKTIGVKIIGIANPQKRPERYIPDVQRAKNELGLSTSITLSKAFCLTIKNLKHGT